MHSLQTKPCALTLNRKSYESGQPDECPDVRTAAQQPYLSEYKSLLTCTSPLPRLLQPRKSRQFCCGTHLSELRFRGRTNLKRRSEDRRTNLQPVKIPSPFLHLNGFCIHDASVKLQNYSGEAAARQSSCGASVGSSHEVLHHAGCLISDTLVTMSHRGLPMCRSLTLRAPRKSK